MSSTDPTGHFPSLSGDSQHASAALAVMSAESAGYTAETDPSELGHDARTENKPVLSAKAAGKQQATGDLIDFGDDDLGPVNDTKPAANPESKPGGPESNQAVSAPPSSEVASEPLTSSMATLKPTSPLPAETATQYLTIEATSYVDPTPPTPRTSQPPSRTPSNATKRRPSSDASPTRSDASYDERRYASEDEQENGSRSEIQSIMEQFTGDGGGPGADEVMSPRLEIASPMLGSPGIQQHPPRKSSLEPLVVPSLSHQVQELQGLRIHSASPASILSPQRVPDDQGPPVPPKDGPPATPSRSHDDRQMSIDSQMSPGMPIHRPPPPEPEPEPALPFDFHRFLEQLRNKKADPVARYLKSFLSEFGKRQWMVHEQVKIISDFLAFIGNKMAQCEVWREVSDAEFDNAREGMEKLVMNRLYTQTFSPAIPPPQPIPGAKPKRRGGERPMGPGRRGQHQEDVERDDILTQKINIYAWLREEHLDIPPAGESGRRFLKLAQQELLKIKSYRAPRDKIICVLNCCKVIFGLLKHSKSDSSADSFMPLLIYVVLQANPEHLVSNVQYILRFRNQEKLGGEAGYYLSSLMGAIQFIENMDRTTLTITDEEFEKNVEAAVSAIAEKHRLDSPPVVQEPAFSEKAGFHQGDSSGRPSLDMMGESSTPRRSTSSNEGGRDADDQAPITGLLRSIQKPLSTIGRMFSDDPSPAPPVPSQASRPPGPSERLSPRPSTEMPPDGQQPGSRHHLSAEEAAARQASAEVAEAQRLSRAEHINVVETLAGMFPDLDRDIISDVVHQKQGRVGQAVDACLALST
ncbi:Vacuolar protein sorting-associated protein 9a [Colletotrichum tanaceti]|uniref:Vacuolar protein sorting-associated protein 9a n=1 Tax=Colletotrichum tanaceti TaxID=1306861 RepID=A0A4U6XKE4_9PEZI|nr:Vacuolar protein sorting-associated protein 9a [Colletotrichum tanaceti]TKW54947.1 Vacuolar protein sorting-associated protein 9a [Colletotrichum tanaceti]